MIIRDLATAEAVYDGAHVGRLEIQAVTGFGDELYDGGWHLKLAVCTMSRARCNLHALLAVALALAGCNQSSVDAPKPAPSGGGTTDIFGSAALPLVDAAAPLPPLEDASAGPCQPDAGPGCPMLRVMKGSIAAAFAAKKGPELATALAKLAASAPAGYTNWASVSRDGAAAAKAGEWTAVKASCRSCHTQYKAKYIVEHRSEPLH